MPVKTVSTTIYVDGVEVGSGSVQYTDESGFALMPTKVRKCDKTPVYVDDTEVGYMELCHDDIIAWWIPGRAVYTLNVPVYVDNTEIGEGVFKIEDSYGASVAVLVLGLILLLVLLRR